MSVVQTYQLTIAAMFQLHKQRHLLQCLRSNALCTAAQSAQSISSSQALASIHITVQVVMF